MGVTSLPARATAQKVLATAFVDGQKLNVVEHADGSSEITYDGKNVFDRHWGAGQLDSCVGVYLGLLRHRQPAR